MKQITIKTTTWQVIFVILLWTAICFIAGKELNSYKKDKLKLELIGQWLDKTLPDWKNWFTLWVFEKENKLEGD